METNEKDLCYKNIFKAKVKDMHICPNCNNRLVDSETYIPVSKDKKEFIKGKYCNKCYRFYTLDYYRVKELLRYNNIAEGYMFEGRDPKKTEEAEINKYVYKVLSDVKYDKKYVDTVNYEYIALLLKFDSGDTQIKIIVFNPYISKINNQVILYTSELGREFLTTFCRSQGNKEGMFAGKKYSIIFSSISGNAKYKYMSNEFKLKEARDFDIEDENVRCHSHLLYSSYMKKLVPIVAYTYGEDDSIYISIKEYKKFVKSYGNPHIKIKAIKNNYDDMLDEFSITEEVLYAFGYSNSNIRNTIFLDRHKILSNILDLEFVKGSKLIRYFWMCIQNHLDACYSAEKFIWESDIRFIEQYTVNKLRYKKK